ncbi:MAG: hypothetical protein CR972_00120 [Candidatus Moraniibacteriota bacterium]|nr:MAG: hypothetical protein CR972_00120 [Candidatus Moranbacteria bacterium]
MENYISIIIPFRDKSDFLERCVRSILEKTQYRYFEILLINNQSKKRRTMRFLDELKNNEKVRIYEYNKSFNFSAINNYAVRYAKGQYLLFLNNDTEVISPQWLDEMMACFEDERIGVVGAQLLYPNNTLQHCGVMLEEKRVAVHAFCRRHEADVSFDKNREWSAVTAACMMTKKNIFLDIGKFDERHLPIAYNDVDYCLKVREKSYKVMCNSCAKLYHYESASRKSDIAAKFFRRKRYKQFIAEQQYMRKRWGDAIQNDPFYDRAIMY